MAGTGYQSSDLLALFKTLVPRLASGDAISDANLYTRLAQAQDDVLADVVNVAWKSVVGAPTAMTSADGGYTWTFGTDGNGYALFPLAARIYPNLVAIPDYPWTPGRDYLDEGTQVRMPNNQAWSGTLYWQGVTPPQALSASVQPVLEPPPARLLIALRAARDFASEGKRDPELYQLMDRRYAEQWAKWATVIRKHLRGRGRLGPLSGSPFGALVGNAISAMP